MLTALITGAASNLAVADINPGLLSDFEDGTTQGWIGKENTGVPPTHIPTGGPNGAGDGFLRVGDGGKLATHNSTPGFTGALNADVGWFEVDMMRPSGDAGSLSMRLVLFGQTLSIRWTSTTAVVVPNDGQWNTYVFSLAEADLIRVQGIGTYAALRGQVSRTMFRHDPGAPDFEGTPVPGTLGIDNVRVVNADLVFNDGFESD